MALGTDIRLFQIGEYVYHAYKRTDGFHENRCAIVTEVKRGRLVIEYNDGTSSDVSPQDRRLSLTSEECNRICRLLNNDYQYKKIMSAGNSIV